MYDEELKNNAVEDIVNESKFDLDILDELNFYNMKECIDKEKQEIFDSEKFDISNNEKRRNEEISEINTNDKLSDSEKQNKIDETNDYYGKAESTYNIIIERKDNVIQKCKEILDEKRVGFEKNIKEFDISLDNLSEMKLYNENIESLNTIDSVRNQDINLIELEEDMKIFENFKSDILKSNFSYEDIKGNVKVINALLDKYPDSKVLAEQSINFSEKSGEILNQKKTELKNFRSTISESKEEAKAYKNTSNPQDFARLMMENDEEAKQFIERKKQLNKEVESLEKKVGEINEESSEYEDIKNQIENKKKENKDLTKKISNIVQHYVDRNIEIEEKRREYARKYKEYSRLKRKVNDLKVKSENIISVDENQREKNDINEQGKNSQSVENVGLNSQEKDEKKKTEQNVKEDTTENLTDEKEKNIVNTTNQRENSSISNEEVNNLKNVQNPINNEQDARRFLDSILKDEEALKSNDYENINTAMELLNSNKSNLKLDKKERNELVNIVDSNIRVSLSQENINEKQSDLISLMNKIGEYMPDDFNSNDMFENLFLYDDQNKMPCIAEGLINSAERKTLAFMIENYSTLLKDGELTQSEIADFEKYILAPINSSMLKENVEQMKTSSRIKNIFSKKGQDPYKLIKSSIEDLNEVKNEISSGVSFCGGEDVYSQEEAIENERKRENNEQSKASQQREQDHEAI